MADFITYEDLINVLSVIQNYLKTNDKSILEKYQAEIRLAKEIDYSIKTYLEYKKKEDFIESSHNPARLAIFLLNYYGERYLEDGELTIFDDDPEGSKASHVNTYTLVLRNSETHYKLFTGNPTSKDKPYDFDTKFINQITIYSDGPKNTTKHAWDSFVNKYVSPERTLDFKSAYWNREKLGHTHGVDYIIQLTKTGYLKVFNNRTDQDKKINFVAGSAGKKYFSEYLKTINLVSQLRAHTWDKFIF